jgi:N utilization substance protein B
MGRRRKARELALQVLYAREINGYPVAEVVADRLAGIEDPELRTYVGLLCERVADRERELDARIAQRAANWDLKRIALIDKLILRMGLCELLWFPDIPGKVCINESIELAKKYSSSDAKRFVNGILDAVWKELRSDSDANRPAE